MFTLTGCELSCSDVILAPDISSFDQK